MASRSVTRGFWRYERQPGPACANVTRGLQSPLARITVAVAINNPFEIGADSQQQDVYFIAQVDLAAARLPPQRRDAVQRVACPVQQLRWILHVGDRYRQQLRSQQAGVGHRSGMSPERSSSRLARGGRGDHLPKHLLALGQRL